MCDKFPFELNLLSIAISYYSQSKRLVIILTPNANNMVVQNLWKENTIT